MRKSALVAAAIVAVMCAAGTPSVHAQDLGTTKQTDFVGKVLLADNNATTASDDKTAAAQTETNNNAEPKAAEAAPAPTPVMVTVQSGDSLSSIAAAHATTWVRLYDANASVANPNIINPGQQLRIPDASEQLASRPLPQAAPAAAATTSISSTTTYRRASTAPATSYPTDPNAAKAYIYSRESGNNPNATNPSGCYGLGQDCNGRVRAACGANYACQDAYFTSYAMGRYGSWEAALAFWRTHGWW